MKKIVLFVVLAGFVAAPLAFAAEQTKVPQGKEELVIDGMSKSREAAGKKPLKGPVPLSHQLHVNKGAACTDCHHGQNPDEDIIPCGDCHGDKASGNTPSLKDAFHGGEGVLPSKHSCIGCHKLVVWEKDKTTKAPINQKPCETCHSLKKK